MNIFKKLFKPNKNNGKGQLEFNLKEENMKTLLKFTRGKFGQGTISYTVTDDGMKAFGIDDQKHYISHEYTPQGLVVTLRVTNEGKHKGQCNKRVSGVTGLQVSYCTVKKPECFRERETAKAVKTCISMDDLTFADDRAGIYVFVKQIPEQWLFAEGEPREEQLKQEDISELMEISTDDLLPDLGLKTIEELPLPESPALVPVPASSNDDDMAMRLLNDGYTVRMTDGRIEVLG